MTRVNRQITATKVRVISVNGQNLGVLSLEDACQVARVEGLDLVEVSGDAKPPVCRIMDYGKFKYDASKKSRKIRAANKPKELKQIRLGKSLRIEEHDLKIKIAQAQKFLMKGHRVQLIQRFQGREMANSGEGRNRMESIAKNLSEIASMESPPKVSDRKMFMILAPRASES